VLVYHRHGASSDGPAPEPPYRLERVPEIDDGALIWRGEHDAGLVRMHLLEFLENSADFQHFAAIHGRLRLPWTEIPVPGMTLHHEATWRRDETQKHVCWFVNDAKLEFRGKAIKGSGRVVLYQSHTPIDAMSQQVRFRWFSGPNVPKPLASFIVGNWVSQWRQDIGIWERKIYRKNPMLTREDGPIHQLRRWYSQFYTAAS
jgi:cholesterol 7-dehydrogenase